MYKVQVTPLIGLPRYDGWAEVVTTFSGKAVWALSVSGEHARNVGKDLLDIIADEGDTRAFDPSEFYQLVSKVVAVAAEKQATLSLSAALLSVDEKSIFCTFDASILLKRESKSGVLLQSKQKLQVIQGQSQFEDVLVFVTKQAEQFGGEVQQKLEQGFGIDSIVASITPTMHLEDSTALSALAFSKVLPVKKTEQPEKKLAVSTARDSALAINVESEVMQAEQSELVLQSSDSKHLSSSSTEEDTPSQETPPPVVQGEAVAETRPQTPQPKEVYDPFFRKLPAQPQQAASVQTDTEQSQRSIVYHPPSVKSVDDESSATDADRLRQFSYGSSYGKDEESDQKKSDFGSESASFDARYQHGRQAESANQGAFAAQQQVLEKLHISGRSRGNDGAVATPQPVSFQQRFSFVQDLVRSLASNARSIVTSVRSSAQTVKLTRVSKGSLLSSLFSRDVYVGKSRNRKSLAVAALVVGILVVVAVVLSIRFYQRSQQRQAAMSQIQPLQERVEQIRGTVESNPIEARSNLQAVIDELESIRAGFAQQQIARSVVNQEIEEVEQLYEQISGREEFNELPVFFDGQADGRSMVVSSVGVTPDEVVFVDADQRQGAVVSASNASEVTLFSISGEQSITDAAVRDFDQTLWLLSDQVYQVELAEGEQEPQAAIDASDQLASAEMISMFGQAAYVLNPEERTIFRFTESEDGFGDATRWVRSVPDLDFEQVSDMTIDGDIWLTTQAGEIFRLRSGNRQDFEIVGLEQPLSSGLQIYTAEGLGNVYILESDASRVVILTKDGEFLREITSSSLAAASEIVVSSDESRLFAVSGSTVYQVDL